MKPHIDQTAFGSITIEGEFLENDVLIRLDVGHRELGLGVGHIAGVQLAQSAKAE